ARRRRAERRPGPGGPRSLGGAGRRRGAAREPARSRLERAPPLRLVHAVHGLPAQPRGAGRGSAGGRGGGRARAAPRARHRGAPRARGLAGGGRGRGLVPPPGARDLLPARGPGARRGARRRARHRRRAGGEPRSAGVAPRAGLGRRGAPAVARRPGHGGGRGGAPGVRGRGPGRPRGAAPLVRRGARPGRGRARERAAEEGVSLGLVLDAFGRAPRVRELAERLPARGAALRLGGLPGSSGAVLAAWLAQRFPQRLFVVAAPSPGDAERWVSDLGLLTDLPVALYPQREALGEDEPHYEIAGERAETIEALLRGRLRLLVTTVRATAERTLVPAALERTRLTLAPGRRQPLGEVVERLALMGYRRVPTVTEVAEFSVRGGIVDVYGFGMAGPARAEWWGDEIASLRGFD